MNCLVADFESDGQEKHEGLRGVSNFEDAFPVSANDHRQRHRHFLNRLAIVAAQLFRMMLPVSADASSSRMTISWDGSIRPYKARTSSKLSVSGEIDSARPENAGFRKDQQRAPRERAIEVLTDRNQASVASDNLSGRFVRYDFHRRYRQQHLVLDHLAHAAGSAGDCDVCNFAQGVMLQLGERRDMLSRHSNADPLMVRCGFDTEPRALGTRRKRHTV
jgi:hypothetical protein